MLIKLDISLTIDITKEEGYMSQTKSRNSHQKRELKQRLYSKNGPNCKLCNKAFPFAALTIDHIIPLAHGGSWHISNLQLACYPCNKEKDDKYTDPWSTI